MLIVSIAFGVKAIAVTSAVFGMISMFMPDSLFLKISYRLKLNKKLNLDKPKSFIAVFNNTAECTLIFEKK